MKRHVLSAVGLLATLVGIFLLIPHPKLPLPSDANPTTTGPDFMYPLDGGATRITKKPFGIYVSPGDSPVSPERFTGYHTGVDFETTPEEKEADVPVKAACNGLLLRKEWASGYGGVAVQSCTLEGQPVTVVYGHIRLSSIVDHVGDRWAQGHQIGVLGTGYSTETDGERKHLHVAVHRGPGVDLLGYVRQRSELSAWVDPAGILR